jgi:hypothetical protein
VTKHPLEDRIGFNGQVPKPGTGADQSARDYINLKLAARGYPIVGEEEDFPFLDMARSLLLNLRERLRQLKTSGPQWTRSEGSVGKDEAIAR